MCFTPSLVCGAWCGGEDYQIHFDNMKFGQGANSALPMCGLYMQKIYADPELGYDPEEPFDIPAWFDPNQGCK
jgi:penicillin-binding protein 1A